MVKYGTIEEAKMMNMHECPGSMCCSDYKSRSQSSSPTPPPQRPAGVKKTIYDPKLGRVVTVGEEDETEPAKKKPKIEPDESPLPGEIKLRGLQGFDVTY